MLPLLLLCNGQCVSASCANNHDFNPITCECCTGAKKTYCPITGQCLKEEEDCTSCNIPTPTFVCPAGTACPLKDGCTQLTDCEACPVNYYSAYAGSECFVCPIGQVSGKGTTTCAPCPYGFQYVAAHTDTTTGLPIEATCEQCTASTCPG